MDSTAPSPLQSRTSTAASSVVGFGRYGSETTTRGIRIRVQPVYLPEQSDPQGRQLDFAYRISIDNLSETVVRLLRRRWTVIDSESRRQDIEGEGVVGVQPTIRPGQAFEYASRCSIRTEWGTMEGGYLLEEAEGRTFEASIGRFFLVARNGRPQA